MIDKNKWGNYLRLPEVEKARKKILDATRDLEFYEDTHTYIYKGVRLESVSGVVSNWESVNEEQMLNICADRAKVIPNYKYYGMSREEIKAAWEAKAKVACDFGTKVHAFGESMFYYMTGSLSTEPVPTCKHEEAAYKFWNDLPVSLIPVLAETRVMNVDTLPYAGTFDILFYYHNVSNPSRSGFVIFDYKTNENLYNEFSHSHHKMMRVPFHDVFEESYGHYVLQQSLYQIPLEKLGLPVLTRVLVWLKPDGTYKKVSTPDKTETLKKALGNMDCLTFQEASCMASVFCPCNPDCKILKKWNRNHESKDQKIMR